MRSYPVSENNFGSAVSEILWYRQTDIVLLCIIDGYRISGYIDRGKFVLNSVRSSSKEGTGWGQGNVQLGVCLY